MNFTNLHYFLTITEELSFTKAAKRLFISQQSLSGHIARLEEECKTALFERSPKLKLTYAGECVANHAMQILNLERQMDDQLSDIINQRRGKLSIGVYQHRSQIFLPKALPQYLKMYPNTEIRLETGLSKRLEEHLLKGELDLIVGFTPFQSEELETFRIITERLCLLVPREMFESKYLNSKAAAAHFREVGVSISEFADLPFLFLEPDNRARVLADQIFSIAGIVPNVLLHVADNQTMLALCQGGIGATMAFEQGAQSLINNSENSRSPDVYILPFAEEWATAELVVAYRKEQYLSNAARNFIAVVSEKFK